MRKISLYRTLFTFILITFVLTVNAKDLIMLRVTQSFPETMVNLQSAIIKTGYKISRVQRVDIGLTKSGFKTDKYRVVFFGIPNQVEELTHKYPDITPYLPLKISIFSEENDTIIISNNPLTMKSYFKDIPGEIFEKWNKDVNQIFSLTGSAD